jgi:hypothetical protein
MALRIWHQSFTVLGDLPAYVDALKTRIAEVVTPGTEVVLHGQVPGTYTSEYPGTNCSGRPRPAKPSARASMPWCWRACPRR